MKLPYAYRGIACLILLLILLPWFSVRWALADTVAAWFECRTLRAELVRAEPVTGHTKVELEEGLLFDGGLLGVLSPVAAQRNVTPGDYRPLVTVRSDGLEVHTAAVTLSGAYANLLHVVHYLEKQLSACRISSLRFVAADPTGRGDRRLEVVVYVEQIVQN